MRNYLFLSAMILLLACKEESRAQPPQSGARVGSSCEGCEAIYENTTPFNELTHEAVLPGYEKAKQKLHLSGVVYQSDGKTPAQGIVIYVYHTNPEGIYPKKGNESGWARRHGYLRGWLRTNARGEYIIKTEKPGSYPNSRIAAHIHAIVKEPQLNEYYIGDFLFEDDPFLTDQERTQNAPGGNGVLKVIKENDMLVARRNIFLGKNVSNYPK